MSAACLLRNPCDLYHVAVSVVTQLAEALSVICSKTEVWRQRS